MRVGFYQNRPIFGEKGNNLKKVSSALKDVYAELIVLPEFFATGYQFTSKEEVAELSEPIPEGPTTKFLTELSIEKHMYIVSGLPERKGDIFYNSAVLTGPKGFIGVYRKTHLFSEEKLFFTPGDSGFRVWDTVAGRIGIMICFDWFFPESMRVLALMGAEVVAHPANIVLPYCPQSMPLRCLENRVYAVTANRIGLESRKEGQSLRYIGQSQVVSPEGEVIVRAPENEEALVVTEINLNPAKNKSINPMNNLFEDRRPDMYGPLFAKIDRKK